MAKALRRGVARYAEGTENVPVADASPFAVSPPPPVRQAPAPATPAWMTPPSGASQLMVGAFKGAQQNPESSPLTAMVGQFADYLMRSNQVGEISKGPSMKDRVVNFFSGNQASTAAIDQHDAASKALRDPLVQQHLMNNPDELALAQRDRVGYATKTQTPEFRKIIETAVAANATAATNPRVTPEELPKVVTTAANHGVTADQAAVSVAPRKYTEDEFIKTFSGIPVKTFALLFGNQLQHVKTPQEKVAGEYFDRLHGAHATTTAKVNAMIAEDEALRKQGKNPVHSQSSWFGKSPLDIAKEQQAATLKSIMDAAAAFTGISAKPYPVPGQQQ